jgi:hypothetical protein
MIGAELIKKYGLTQFDWKIHDSEYKDSDQQQTVHDGFNFG